MQRYWLANRERFICNQLGFSSRSGNIVKLAIERDNREFINDLVRRWGVDLNFVDPSDGRTALDFVEYRLETNDGLESANDRIRTILLNYGAKRANEL